MTDAWPGVRPDRDRDAHGRRAASRRRRARHRRLPLAGAHVARSRALRRPLRDGRRRARPRLAPRGGPARRRGAASLQRRPPRADPGAAAARDGARGDRGASGRDARDRRRPGSHAPQVRRPRRRGGLGRLDELDGRLVVAPGERHRHGRVAARSPTRTRSRSSSSGTRGDVEGSGEVDPRPADVDGARVRAWFTPEHGEALSHRIAKHLGKARTGSASRRPCSRPGRSSATLVEIVKEQRCDLAGVVDDTQVDQVFHQWRTNGVSAWKIPLLQSVLEGAPWSGKESIPWTPESVHDFMHAKVVVADDTVVRRELQPLALGRAERGERPRDPRRATSPTGSPRSSTRSAGATRLRPSPPDPLGSRRDHRRRPGRRARGGAGGSDGSRGRAVRVLEGDLRRRTRRARRLGGDARLVRRLLRGLLRADALRRRTRHDHGRRRRRDERSSRASSCSARTGGPACGPWTRPCARRTRSSRPAE